MDQWLVERVNRFLKSCLRRIVLRTDYQDWKLHLNSIPYIINNTFHSSLRASPFKLLFDFDQRNHRDAEFVRFLDECAKIEFDYNNEKKNSQSIAIEAINKIKEYNKIMKIGTKSLRNIILVDFVLIRDSSLNEGEDRKLKLKYKGLYLMAKALNNNK